MWKAEELKDAKKGLFQPTKSFFKLKEHPKRDLNNIQMPKIGKGTKVIFDLILNAIGYRISTKGDVIKPYRLEYTQLVKPFEFCSPKEDINHILLRS